ncbi:MAG TPA: HTTM domain-containing protein [Pirellulales bacterium]|nr:HTTM domain-containing protein [Pirellulales bacterium]
MKLVWQYLRELFAAAVNGWSRFWFAPADPATLGMIRIMAGAMLFYTHAVWSLGLNDFFGPTAWISDAAAKLQTGDTWAWSYLWKINSPALLWTVHVAALVVFAMLTVGLFSRIASVLAFVAAVSYVNRTPGALFGLDQVNVMLATYLMVGPSGAAFSVDRWLAARRAGQGSRLEPAEPSTGANVAIRLIQVHMCIIYFFAGLSKMQGSMWWSGTAMWGAFANLEYQSLDMTWMCRWPILVALMTQTTAYWELFFPAIIWPRLLRPIVLFFAIPLHLGIGLMLGMWTFGLAMLIGCSSFVSPALVRRVFDRGSVAEAGDEAEAPRSTDDAVRRPAGAKIRRQAGASRA